jgi:hypothetical protein
MQISTSPIRNEALNVNDAHNEEGASSAVSWPAILAGMFTIVALSLILIAFGAGLDFASPLPHERISAVHFTYLAAVWLIVVQWLSSGLGGYLTGRLRTKWVGVHTHEVFFRDTAHGFLTWAVATVVSALILLLAASTSISGNTHTMGMSSISPSRGQSSIVLEGDSASATFYYVDSLLRSDHPETVVDPGTKEEMTHILVKGMKEGLLSETDKAYLAQLIFTHTGLKLSDAEKRVDDMMLQIRQSTDEAHKMAASVSIYTFLSMLIGAFIASAAAALGGKQRDAPYLHSI